MHDFWTIPTVNMAYARSPNYLNMMAGKIWNTNIQSCGGCIVAFAIAVRCFCPHKFTSPFLFLTRGLSIFIQVSYLLLQILLITPHSIVNKIGKTFVFN